ncbi:type II toxin-antitoxin system VapC family toxin [candidate division KSB1 bacterium]|nr:type II toxin-antitoxin system VapC family toxin [candidate division KSB1 bacterium]MBL7094453.1 type II toxin-antitoxin system VapC family toxin [candidate division KSB1 bacterium]
MIYLLDTNVCINYLNGTSDSVKVQLESKKPEEIALCSVVKAELIYGALKSSRPDQNLDRLNLFLGQLYSFKFDDHSAKIYGLIRSQLEKSGTIIGPNDLLIAAIALANNTILVTNNVREFSRIKNLTIEDWENI